ncbi:unnamed protein product [Clonostachys byssicola]|uniref:Uncharacterized protein n=1 Tax=Clonostachys byssicola TaxID=160290 RepID=A0A9N9UGQ9_9HYPO|nr:unnamed protein product [Clonostachys byssicola]
MSKASQTEQVNEYAHLMQHQQNLNGHTALQDAEVSVGFLQNNPNMIDNESSSGLCRSPSLSTIHSAEIGASTTEPRKEPKETAESKQRKKPKETAESK